MDLRLDATVKDLPAIVHALLATLEQPLHVREDGTLYPDKVRGRFRGVPLVAMLGCHKVNEASAYGSTPASLGRISVEVPVPTRGFLTVASCHDDVAAMDDLRFVLTQGFRLSCAPRAVGEQLFDEASMARLSALIEACRARRFQFGLTIDRDRVELDVGAPTDAGSLAFVLETAVWIATRVHATLGASGPLDAHPEVQAMRQRRSRRRTGAIAMLVAFIVGIIALFITVAVVAR